MQPNEHIENDSADKHTTTNKGTETLDAGIVGSEHVNKNDDPARQPDRRDQSGNGFDDNINEDTVGSTAPKSDELSDLNRYATVDNAQSRTLNTDQKD